MPGVNSAEPVHFVRTDPFPSLCVRLPVSDVSLIYRIELDFILSLNLEVLSPGRFNSFTLIVVTDTRGLVHAAFY